MQPDPPAAVPSDPIDRKSFILGMITAFAECVANECKKVAFSPPFYPRDHAVIKPGAEAIAADLSVQLWLEKNPDLTPERPLQWLVIYKFEEALEEYRRLRSEGFNPALHLESFAGLLSYGSAWPEGAGPVTPKMREIRPMRDAFARVLLRPGDWPPAPA